MKSGKRRKNIPPLKVDQPHSQGNTQTLLKQRIDSAERETGSLVKQLSALGFLPEKVVLPVEGRGAGGSRTPVTTKTSGDINRHTLHKNYEGLVARVCRAESLIQTLKLNLCALQAEKDLYWTESSDVQEQLKEELERGLEAEQKLRLDLQRVGRELDRVRGEKLDLEAKLDRKEETLIRQDINQSTVSEEDKLAKLRLSRKVTELSKELAHEVDLRGQLEASHNTVLQRIHGMEGMVEQERKEMQRIVTAHAKLADERDRVKRENRHLGEKNLAMQENVGKITKELGLKDAQLTAIEEQLGGNANRGSIVQAIDQNRSLLVRIRDLGNESVTWKQKCAHLEGELKLARDQSDKMKLDKREATQALIDRSVEQSINDRDQLSQQLLEAKMEIDELMRDKHSLEADRRRLEERIGTMEEQQIIHQKVESSISDLTESKNRLAYEKGQLQQRLEALQREVEGSARTRTENAHLKKTTSSLESQLQIKSDELSTTQLSLHQLRAQLRQEQNTSQMKERDFEMAIKARDGAVRDVEAMSMRMEDMKHQGGIKVSGLQKTLADAQADHSKMAAMVNSVMSSQHNLQATVETLQTDLGRKDRDLATLERERQNQQTAICHLQAELEQRELKLNHLQHGGMKRVEVLQRELNTVNEENKSLSRALEDLSQANLQLQAALDGMQGELGRLKNDKAQLQVRRESEEKGASQQIDGLQEQLSSIQRQMTSQKSLVNKQAQKELANLRKTHTELMSRFNDISKANTELHKRTVELEESLKRSKERMKSQKAQIQGLSSLKERNDELSKENNSLKAGLEEFREAKRTFVRKNREQGETIAAFVEQVEQLQEEIGNVAVKGPRAPTTSTEEANRRKVEQLEKENAALIERLTGAEDENSNLATKLAEVSVESDEISAHLQDAHQWFQSKYSSLQRELTEANKSQAELKKAVIQGDKEKSKSDKQTQRAYEIIRSSREALGRLAGQVEREHVESRSQMHHLARRVQAEKDHSIYVERKCKKLMDSSATCVEDLAIELDQTRTLLDTIR